MRNSALTLVRILGASTLLLLPIAGCSSSSGNPSGTDSGADTSPGVDAGHDAKVKDTGAKDTGSKETGSKDAGHDVESKDVTTDVVHVDAAQHEAGEDAKSDVVPHDGALGDAHHDGAGGDAHHDAAHDSGHDAGPALEKYYFEGRWDTTSVAAYATQPLAEWAGSAVHSTFTGTGIGIDFVETANANLVSEGGGGFDSLYVVIDAKTPVIVPLTAGYQTGGTCPLPTGETCVVGENAFSVASGLSAGTHTISIYKTTDPYYGGKIQFKQLIPSGAGAAIVPAAYTFSHHIEWIGDDINVGRGAVATGVPTGCTNTNAAGEAMNAASVEPESYAGLVSTHFQAERHDVSIASSGIASSVGAAPLLPSVYGNVLPDETMNAFNFAHWSPSALQPDLVVVNLGSYGDFSNCGGATDCSQDVGATGTPTAGSFEASFATAYIQFLATVRAKYATAFILVVSGNGYAGNISPIAAGDLANYVVNQRVTAGEKLGMTIGFYSDASAVNMGDFTYNCGYYPDTASQATLATALEAQIHTYLNW